MDYEELYNEALERAKKLQETCDNPSVVGWCEYIFPQLRESEDEKIRKAIIEFFKLQDDNTTYSLVPKNDILAWLEKQNEFKNIDSDDLATLEIWKNAIKENKGKWQLSDWFIEATSLLIQKVKRIENNPNKKPQRIVSAEAKEAMYDKPAWSEEDLEKASTEYANNEEYGDDVYYAIKAAFKEGAKWNKPAWSEVDESIALGVEQLCNCASLLNIAPDKIDKIRAWLKSLRPQNTWKPSDEHYELEEFAKIVRGNLTGISKAVLELFKAKYLQLTGNKMYGGFKD